MAVNMLRLGSTCDVHSNAHALPVRSLAPNLTSVSVRSWSISVLHALDGRVCMLHACMHACPAGSWQVAAAALIVHHACFAGCRPPAEASAGVRTHPGPQHIANQPPGCACVAEPGQIVLAMLLRPAVPPAATACKVEQLLSQEHKICHILTHEHDVVNQGGTAEGASC